MSSGVVRANRAIAGSLVAASLFEAVLLVTKETPSIYDHAPWQNDPYDTAVSFALFCVPLIAVPSALRLLAGASCPPELARLGDLLRACGVGLAVVAVTLAACWAALAQGASRPAWNSVTAVQVGALAVFSFGTVACTAGIRRAAAALRRDGVTATDARPARDGGFGQDAGLARDARAGQDAGASLALRPAPDWLGDLVRAGRLLAGLAGPAGRPVRLLLDWADKRIVPVVRRHPVGTAAVLGIVVGLLVAISQSVNEGYQAGVAVVFFCVVTSGVFAFVMTAGWYLRVVRADRPAGARAPAIRATVLAAAAVPVALAFRASLWSLVGASPETSGLPALCLLLAATAVLVFAASLAADRLARSRRASAHPR
jgi:hypothetical protein